MPSHTLHILRNPHGYSEETIRTAQLDAADTVESVTRDNMLRKQDEVALAERIAKLEADNAMLRHDLTNANFALSLLKGNSDGH